MEPPRILRIKRKRGQDPLQALILEDSLSVKRSKPSSPLTSGSVTPNDDTAYYFKFTTTEINHVEESLNSILSETTTSNQERNFVIAQSNSTDDNIPKQLSELINNFMITDDTPQSHHRKKRNASDSPPLILKEEEYVYDVYQLAPMTDQNHPKSQIGYVKFFDNDNESQQVSEHSDVPVYSDNEDSNAEDYYQNDYPEDEDVDIANDIHNDYKATTLEDDEIDHLYHQVNINDLTLLNNYDSNEDENYSNEDVDDEDDDEDEDEDFERQKFFDNESEDELAIHRDKIFGKLKSMINE